MTSSRSWRTASWASELDARSEPGTPAATGRGQGADIKRDDPGLPESNVKAPERCSNVRSGVSFSLPVAPIRHPRPGPGCMPQSP